MSPPTIHPVAEAVQAWRMDHADAADRLLALPEVQRYRALVSLGYNTPAHMTLFSLDESLAVEECL